MNKLLFSALFSIAALPCVATNSAGWEIKTDPIVGGGNFPATASGRQALADFNNDGILDYFIIAGQQSASIGLYKGNADGTYTDVTSNSPELYAKSKSSALFIDINNDGNLDLITIGEESSSPLTDVYINSGAPDYKFVADYDIIDTLPGLFTEANDNGTKVLASIDYNNDGWTDLLINGNAKGIWEEPDGNGQGRVVAIMKNNHGKFELLKNPVDGTSNFTGMNGGSVDVGDFNRDGWVDIITSGYEDTQKNITILYKNNGNGTFTEMKGIEFKGHQQGETAFIDVNNDGYLDIIEIGRDVKNGWATFGKLYINNQNETFTRIDEDKTNMFGGGCALAIGDVNNDGLVDFFMTGWNTNSTFMYNNGDNSFMKQNLVPDAARCRGGATTFADVNNDGLLDLSIFGYRDGGGNPPSGDGLGMWPDYILMNKGGDGIKANVAPTAPTGVKKTYNSTKGCYLLEWSKSTDDTTPADAIRYNVSVKTSDGKFNSILPADRSTGKLKVSGTQYPLVQKNSYELYIPENDNTEIGVQAIDNGWAASSFTVATTSGVESIANDNGCNVVIVENQAIVTNNSNENAIIYIITIDGRIANQVVCVAGTSVNVSLLQGVNLIKVTSNQGSIVKKAVAR